MKNFTLLLILSIIILTAAAQTNTFPISGSAGIGTVTPNSSSLLDINSTTKGVLIPRMTKTQRDAIVSPATGLLIYQSTNNPGFYYFDGSSWSAVSPKRANTTLSNLVAPTAVNADLLPDATNTRSLGSGALRWKDVNLTTLKFSDGSTQSSAGWNLAGNSGTSSDNFIGTTDDKPITFKTNSKFSGTIDPSKGNILFGRDAGNSGTQGQHNTAIGNGALRNYMKSYSVAIGDSSLFASTQSDMNEDAFNVAIGFNCMRFTTIGAGNAAVGSAALYFNTTGFWNMAFGGSALSNNTTGSDNVGVGTASLFSNKTGSGNTAIGSFAGGANFTSDGGSGNTIIGAYADVLDETINNGTAIGALAICDQSDRVRIGNETVGSIGGQVDWTSFSDARFKTNIHEDVKGLEFILDLRPVTYQLDIHKLRDFRTTGKTFTNKSSEKMNELFEKNAAEKEKIRYTGFLAQEVEEVAARCGFDFSGVDKPSDPSKSTYGLRYAEFVVPLVKAVQELSAQVQSQDKAINLEKIENETLRKKNDELEQRLEKIESILSLSGDAQSDEEIKQETVILSGGGYLKQNVPNPFDNTTVISYYVSDLNAQVEMQFISVAGEVLQIVSLATGKGGVTVKAEDLPAGTYQYSLLVNGKNIATKKMQLVK